MSDTVASLSLTGAQGRRNKAIQKDGFKTPDLIIFESMGRYCGLFIELKATDDDLFKKRSKDLKNDHVTGQYKSIHDLRAKGYFACFCSGFDETKNVIDTYMKLSKNKTLRP
jgi:hypothetical protein